VLFIEFLFLLGGFPESHEVVILSSDRLAQSISSSRQMVRYCEDTRPSQ
jgi:hypothetical protein